MFHTDLLYGGADRPASNGATFERLNPATGRVATRAAAASLDDVDAAVAAARDAFPAWSALPPGERRALLLAAAEKMEALRARFVEAAVDEAGFAPGVVNVITNAPQDAPQVVERLIAHPAVRRINFTGSTRVGRIIAQQAAAHLKPVLLELGGKNPVIVLDDADLDAAVEAAAFSAFFNQGQICMSADRILVHRKAAPQFIDNLAAKTATLKAARGATVIQAGGVDGNIMQPAIVDGITPDMLVYQEESFGPIVSIVRFDSDEEAIRLANDNEYGLSAAVFSRDVGRALAVARRIESGICHVNGPTVHDEAQMPFGGVKGSGYGRFGGRAAIAEFTDLSWITVQTAPRHYPI